MNFILTTRCNKGCPYCFAEFYRKEVESDDREMSFGTFLKMIDKITVKDDGKRHLKFLGGEPTLHKDFIKMCDEAIRREIVFTLISNFLFDEDTRNYILHLIKSKIPISFLINSTNLDENEENLNKFVANYSAIYKELYVRDLEEVLSCGFTLENEKSVEDYISYYDFLVSKVMKIERLRLSLQFPGYEEDKGDFWFINNHEIGDKFIGIMKRAIDTGTTVTIDCIVFPCMFSNKEKLKFVKKFTERVGFYCGDTAPTDIFPDEKISFCYPTKDLLSIDSNKHKDLTSVVKELTTRYKIIESRVEKPEVCINCNFYKNKICHGPCLGFYKLEDETLGLNL